MTDMEGKVCIVTGATSGVGRETARGLARMGATVVLAVRDAQRGDATRRDISATSGNADVHVLPLDLARLDSVRAFPKAFSARFDRLDVLVNNAGIHTARRELTPDGFELTLATNHIGHFLLTDLLRDVLVRSAPARIVNVASEAHRFSPGFRFADPMSEKHWSGLLAYTQSKLANIMFTFALARRLEGTGVTANAVHPGSVRSGWARGEESGVFRYAAKLATPFLISPEKGARTSLMAATSPEARARSGAYLVRGKISVPSRAARDVEAQERLWRLSEEWVRAGATAKAAR